MTPITQAALGVPTHSWVIVHAAAKNWWCHYESGWRSGPVNKFSNLLKSHCSLYGMNSQCFIPEHRELIGGTSLWSSIWHYPFNWGFGYCSSRVRLSKNLFCIHLVADIYIRVATEPHTESPQSTLIKPETPCLMPSTCSRSFMCPHALLFRFYTLLLLSLTPALIQIRLQLGSVGHLFVLYPCSSLFSFMLSFSSANNVSFLPPNRYWKK